MDGTAASAPLAPPAPASAPALSLSLALPLSGCDQLPPPPPPPSSTMDPHHQHHHHHALSHAQGQAQAQAHPHLLDKEAHHHHLLSLPLPLPLATHPPSLALSLAYTHTHTHTLPQAHHAHSLLPPLPLPLPLSHQHHHQHQQQQQQHQHQLHHQHPHLYQQHYLHHHPLNLQQQQLPSPPSSRPLVPAPHRLLPPPPPAPVLSAYPPSPPHLSTVSSAASTSEHSAVASMKRYGSYADFAASIHPNTLPQCAADRIPLDSQLPAAAGPNLAVPQNLYWPSDAVPATPDNQQYACLLYNSPDVRKMNSLGGGVGFNSDAEIRCNGNQLAHRPVINVESSNARQQKASKGSSSLKEPSSGGSSLINSPLSASASTSVVHTQPQSAAARAPIATRKAAKVFTVPARVTRSQTRRQVLEAQLKLKQQEEMALKSSSAVVLPPPKSVAEPSQVKEPSTNDIIRQKQQNTLGAPVMDSFQYSASNCALPHSPNSAQQTPLMYSPAGCYYQRTSLRSYPPSAFSLYPLHQPQPQGMLNPQLHCHEYPPSHSLSLPNASSVNLPLPYPHSQQSQQRFQGMEVIDLTGSGSPDVQGDAKRRRLNANDTWASAYNRQLQQSHQQARHQQHLQQLEFQKRQQELLVTQKQPTLTKPAISLAECDDKDGHYIVRAGDFLTSRYQIVRLLGQGTFGKVVEAIDCSRSGARVAIKIVRSVQKYREAAKIEVKVLTALKKNDPLNLKRCIHLLSTFEHRNHTCMVFELLAQSIFDFLKENHFNPFPMYHIQAFAKQILDSIAFMHDLRLIHTDLKP
ncbi:dual specificity protein kinase kns1, partial [Entophlyctis sp. JEL0112]